MNIFDLINADFARITSNVDIGVNEDGSKFGFIVVGTDSPQYLAENDRQRNEGLARGRAAKKDPSLKIDLETDEGRAVYEERLQANYTGQALAVTVGWYGFTEPSSDKGAAPVEAAFNKDTLARMFAKKRAWREQVLAAINEDARFLPKPAKS